MLFSTYGPLALSRREAMVSRVKPHAKILEAVAFMRENLARPLTVDEIARRVGGAPKLKRPSYSMEGLVL